MLIRSLLIALFVSVVSCTAIYLLVSPNEGFHYQAAHLPQTALAVFLLSLFSGLINARLSGLSTGTHGCSDSTGDPVDGPRETGNVKWFNASKGFGFITRDRGDDVFVHFRSIRGQGHRVLHDGQRVEFVVSKGNKGLQAEDVAIAR